MNAELTKRNRKEELLVGKKESVLSSLTYNNSLPICFLDCDVRRAWASGDVRGKEGVDRSYILEFRSSDDDILGEHLTRKSSPIVN